MMLIRIVKMTFQENRIGDFLDSFNRIKETIKEFKGCEHLELYQDKHDKHVFFTYSYWASEEDLNHYRNSDFFNEIWPKTKAWFKEKPEAWSVDKVVSI